MRSVQIIRKLSNEQPATYQIVEELRCPGCGKLLGKNLDGSITLYCRKCKKEIFLQRHLKTA